MRNTNQKMRSDRKKLSWIYRKKVKLQKSAKPVENEDDTGEGNKKPRIIVRNLPFKASKDDVRKLYEPFGQIEEINFPKHADNTPIGCCFIQFRQLEDASKAIFNTNKKEFMGRILSSGWAVSKSKYCEKLKMESVLDATDTKDQDVNESIEVHKDETKREEDSFKKQKLITVKQERRKLLKEKQRQKRARIVLRNLSFQVTEENLREHFSQYGTIQEIIILKKEDGRSAGCAFLQFEHVQSAARAIHYANLQLLLDRPVIVDWAVPKHKFSKNNSENVNNEEVEVKVEKEIDTESNSNEELSRENKEHVNVVTEINESDDENLINETEIKVESEVSSTSAEGKDMVGEIEEQEVEKTKRLRYESHDVSEGKTLFLKNVPFSVKNEQLKKYMEQFGPIYYALVCIDPITEYSKGTAFVKFKNIEDANKCLEAGNELEIDDQRLEVQRALDRNEIENKENSKQQKYKDSRNLYLVREGVILAGSPAAVGVSATDMAKRLQLEQWKSQILRNLNMFVSRVRLVVHNLPPTLDDVKLRKIFERHSPPKAVVREARVMRDLRNVNLKGVEKSKEYGFVSFTTHEDALQTLRNVNNNPNIFTPYRRPIVSFSIENRVMVNAKQRRIQKSRENNPLWSGNKAKRKGEDISEETSGKKLKMDDVDEKPFTGMVATPGENKLRSKYKLKTQAMIHKETVKKEKKMKKSSKKLEQKRRMKSDSKNEMKMKQRMKVKGDDVNLDKLVNRYKDKLKTVELKKSKWYES
ncbi:RNA-binding protein 28 [Calliopsis andreniformis]|uniref:RNA-binding protein 28 n=1 Tax=Calliopsis andreniformis TaxID=337506 RepID=UPI003FCE17E7